MPRDPITGVIADIVADPSSIPGRMNPGNVYEQYFGELSRHVQRMVINKIKDMNTTYDALTDKQVKELMSIPIGLLKIIGTEQYDSYKKANAMQQHTIIKEIVTKEFYIFYAVSSVKKPYQITMDTLNTVYDPPRNKLTWTTLDGEVIVTHDEIAIAPQYMILLSKTADAFLACASAATNHYSFPVGVSAKNRSDMPYRNNPVRVLSETETRLYASYLDILPEIKDRANSLSTHKVVYRTILDAPVPTNIGTCVDRSKVPFGTDASLEFLDNLINVAGFELAYAPDVSKLHPPK